MPNTINEFDTLAAEHYIHEEIASQGTNSMFLSRGLNVETGEYDVDAIIEAIKAGKFPNLLGQFTITSS